MYVYMINMNFQNSWHVGSDNKQQIYFVRPYHNLSPQHNKGIMVITLSSQSALCHMVFTQTQEVDVLIDSKQCKMQLHIAVM